MNETANSALNINSKVIKWFWLIALIDMVLIQLSQSTFDSGDSVLHYLQSSIAFQHPEYFMDHWSKPLFVLLSSPFSYFGFKGMVLFNSLCVLGATFFIFLTLSKYTNHAWILIPIAFSCPEWVFCQSSGLTEPLFALLLSLSIWFFVNDHTKLAMLVVGFLPFVRSEGWLLMPVWAVLFIVQKNYRNIWPLAIGHLAYGIAGFIVLGDFLWMFHQNPYQGIEKKYGHGHWMHYIEQTPYLMGIPIGILFFLGIFILSFRFLSGKPKTLPFNPVFLTLGICAAFYVSHSIFWQMGWFHSFGLKRVFIAIFPCMLLAATLPLIMLQTAFPNKLNYLIIALIVVFPCTANKSGFRFPDSVKKGEEQRNIDLALQKAEILKLNKAPYAFGNYYVALASKRDIRNPEQVCPIEFALREKLPSGTLIFWDPYFAVSDKNVTAQAFNNRKWYDSIGTFGEKGSLNRVELYRSR